MSIVNAEGLAQIRKMVDEKRNQNMTELTGAPGFLIGMRSTRVRVIKASNYATIVKARKAVGPVENQSGALTM